MHTAGAWPPRALGVRTAIDGPFRDEIAVDHTAHSPPSSYSPATFPVYSDGVMNTQPFDVRNPMIETKPCHR